MDFVTTSKGLRVRLRQEHWNHHHGQHDMSIVAIDPATGKPIGRVDFALFQGLAHVGYVEAAVRRRGVGLAMIAALAEEYGAGNIEWGMTTPSGSALKASFERSLAETAGRPATDAGPATEPGADGEPPTRP